MAKHKHYHLTARQDFGRYKKGDHIEDEIEVEAILNGEQRVHVIQVHADPEAAEEATPKSPPALPKPDAKDAAEAR